MPTDFTPSRNEEEYFAQVNADLRKELRARADAERQSSIAAERNKCPRDNAQLVAKQVGPVTIDQCPECEGIWLDKGELEIIAAGKSEQSGFLGSVLRVFK